MIPRSLMRGAALRQDTRGWALALVLMLGAIVCVLMSRGPVAPLEQMSRTAGQLDGSRTAMLQVAAAALLVLAIPATLLRRHTSALWWVVVMSIVVNSVLLAGSTSVAGLVLTSMAYTYAVLYAAYAFERRLLVGVLVAVVVGSLVGSSLSSTGFRFIVWFSTVGGVVIAGAVLGHVMQLLRWYATVDALTGVLTRTAFDATAHSALSSARRRGAQSVLVLIDLDGFKAVNDTHGHAAGDELLVATVEAWGRRLRPDSCHPLPSRVTAGG